MPKRQSEAEAAKPEVTRSFIKKRKPLGPKASLARCRKQSAEEREWVYQYRQGKDRDELGDSHLFCGAGLFSTPDPIPFKSPYNGEMKFEIQNGIRFVGPKYWTGDIKIAGESWGCPLIILYPMISTEQILIRPAADEEIVSSSQRAHLVTIIPTGCVGTSSLTRVLPTIIEFEMPDKKLGSDAVGYRKEIIKNETYLSGFTTSINQLLEKIGKKVINLGGDSEDQLSCKSTWTRDETNALGTKGKDQGTLYLIPEGIFFASEAQNEDGSPRHIYIPIDPKSSPEKRKVLDSIILIADKGPSGNGGRKLVGVTMWLFGVKPSPFWPTPKDTSPSDPGSSYRSSREEVLQLMYIDPEFLDPLFSYMKKYYLHGDDASTATSEDSTNKKDSNDTQASKSPPTPLRRSTRLRKKAKLDDDKENEDPEPTEAAESKPKPEFKKPEGPKSGITLEREERWWYDYQENQPATGLMDYKP